jgi:hypothetical protein
VILNMEPSNRTSAAYASLQRVIRAIFSTEILPAGASCDIVAGFRPETFWIGRADFAVLQVTATDPATGAIVDAVTVEFRGVTRA